MMATLREEQPELFEEPVDPRAIFEAYVAKYPDAGITDWDEMLDFLASAHEKADKA